MILKVLHEAHLVADNLALDFVNTSTGRNMSRNWGDYLTDAMDVLVWLRHAEAIDEVRFREMTRIVANDDAASEALRRSALQLRHALAGLVQALTSGRAPDDADMCVLNMILGAARAAERVTWTPEGMRCVTSTDPSSLEDALWPIALAAERILTSAAPKRVKKCCSSTCEWVFLDTSKNASRRWCQMEVCGNREKGRRRLKRERDPSDHREA